MFALRALLIRKQTNAEWRWNDRKRTAKVNGSGNPLDFYCLLLSALFQPIYHFAPFYEAMEYIHGGKTWKLWMHDIFICI